MDKAQTARSKKAFIEALTKTLGVITAACETSGIPRRTVYNWIRDDEEFKEAVNDTNEVALDFAENALHRQIKDGVPASTIFFLKTKGKKRGYTERQEIEVTAPKGLSWLDETSD